MFCLPPKKYRYLWPAADWQRSDWRPVAGKAVHERLLPETLDELARDSRWPAFFPAPICLVTTSDGKRTAMEKVVGASIVNRFPYVIALSFCRQPLSARHHVRRSFMDVLESGGTVAVQFLPPGDALDKAMRVVLDRSDAESAARLGAAGLPTRPALGNRCPVFCDAYMVYEARLVKPGRDFDGLPIYESAWTDVGSHRVYFLEITAIQLRRDIARGDRSIHWRSLPAWTPQEELQRLPKPSQSASLAGRYIKTYTPHYVFPSQGTIAFEADGEADGMAVKHLPPLPEDQVEVDNDRARWPCFFPSSAGLITTWAGNGQPDIMPCGSTTVISRHPLVVAPCISYAAINERYAARASLEFIRRTGKFGCGVPFVHDLITGAVQYAGNTSFHLDPQKMASAGLAVENEAWAPRLSAVPIHYDCEVAGEIRLGTHIMFLGEVRRIVVRDDVGPQNALEWYPCAALPEASR